MDAIEKRQTVTKAAEGPDNVTATHPGAVCSGTWEHPPRLRIERDGTVKVDTQTDDMAATHLETVQAPSLDDLLGRPLDEVSWQHLETAYPVLAEALQEVTRYGYSPQQVRQYVMQRELPLAWARWLEQAARFLRE